MYYYSWPPQNLERAGRKFCRSLRATMKAFADVQRDPCGDENWEVLKVDISL